MSLSTTWLSDIFAKVSETCLLHEQSGVFMTADIADYPDLLDRMFCVIPVTGVNGEKGLLFCEDVNKNFKYEELLQCGVMSPFKERPDESLGVHGEVFTDTSLTGDQIRALCNILHLRYSETENPLFVVEESLIPVSDQQNQIKELEETNVSVIPVASNNTHTLH